MQSYGTLKISFVKDVPTFQANKNIQQVAFCIVPAAFQKYVDKYDKIIENNLSTPNNHSDILTYHYNFYSLKTSVTMT